MMTCPAMIVLLGHAQRLGRRVALAQGGAMWVSGHGVRSRAGVEQAEGLGMPQHGRALSMHALVMRSR